jgi:hypothetical protein
MHLRGRKVIDYFIGELGGLGIDEDSAIANLAILEIILHIFKSRRSSLSRSLKEYLIQKGVRQEYAYKLAQYQETKEYAYYFGGLLTNKIIDGLVKEYEDVGFSRKLGLSNPGKLRILEDLNIPVQKVTLEMDIETLIKNKKEALKRNMHDFAHDIQVTILTILKKRRAPIKIEGKNETLKPEEAIKAYKEGRYDFKKIDNELVAIPLKEVRRFDEPVLAKSSVGNIFDVLSNQVQPIKKGELLKIIGRSESSINMNLVNLVTHLKLVRRIHRGSYVLYLATDETIRYSKQIQPILNQLKTRPTKDELARVKIELDRTIENWDKTQETLIYIFKGKRLEESRKGIQQKLVDAGIHPEHAKILVYYEGLNENLLDYDSNMINKVMDYFITNLNERGIKKDAYINKENGRLIVITAGLQTIDNKEESFYSNPAILEILLNVFKPKKGNHRGRKAVNNWLRRKLEARGKGVNKEYANAIAKFKKADKQLFNLNPILINSTMDSLMKDFNDLGVDRKIAFRNPGQILQLKRLGLPTTKTIVEKNYNNVNFALKNKQELINRGFEELMPANVFVPFEKVILKKLNNYKAPIKIKHQKKILSSKEAIDAYQNKEIDIKQVNARLIAIKIIKRVKVPYDIPLRLLYNNKNFSNNSITLKDLYDQGIYCHIDTLRRRFRNLIKVGLVELDKEEQPYRYYLSDVLKRAPPKAIERICRVPLLNLYPRSLSNNELRGLKDAINKILSEVTGVRNVLLVEKYKGNGWNSGVLGKVMEINQKAEQDIMKVLGRKIRFKDIELISEPAAYPTAFDIDSKEEFINLASTLHSPSEDGEMFFEVMDTHIRHDFGHYISYESLIPEGERYSAYEVAAHLKQGVPNHPYIKGLSIDVDKYTSFFKDDIIWCAMEIVAHKIGSILQGEGAYRRGYQGGIDYAVKKYEQWSEGRNFNFSKSLPYLACWHVLTVELGDLESANRLFKSAIKALRIDAGIIIKYERLLNDYTRIWKEMKLKRSVF